MKIVEVHEINAADILKIYDNMKNENKIDKIQNIKQKIDNILDKITIEEIEDRIKEDEENPCDYELVIEGAYNMNKNEEDDLGDWLIDREDCIEFPYSKNKNEIVSDLNDWINGKEFNLDEVKEKLRILINNIEKDWR